MKNKFLKRSITLFLVLTTLISTAALGISSASAFNIKTDSYFFEIYFSEGKGDTMGTFFILPICGNSVTRGATKSANRNTSAPYTRVNFNDFYSSDGITGVYLKMEDSDSMYIEKIVGYSVEHPEPVTFHGGHWVDSFNGVYFYPDEDVYKATIKTSNDSNSGTDLFVDATLYTTTGKSETIRINDLISGDAFEKGSTHTFYIGSSTSQGTFERLEISLKSDSSTLINLIDTTTASAWKMESLEIEKVQGEIKEDTFTIETEQWLDNGDSCCYSNQSGKTSAFAVTVKTSSVSKAGTDATLDMSINNSNKTISLGEFADYYSSGNHFEKGSENFFRIPYPTTENIGEIKSITIHNKGNNAGPGWHLEYIKLTEILPDGTKGKTYTFNYNNWIDADSTVTLTNPVIS